jgi:hypothetical protein
MPERDVVYLGGRVNGREVAIRVRGGRIVAIGPAGGIVPDAAIDSAGAAVIVDLGGSVVLPGLIDAHCHPSQVAYLLSGAFCSQPAAPDIAAVQERLARTEPGGDGWVTGYGFAEYKLAERRMPTRDDLDAAVGDRPCVLYQVSLHACVVNSAGLRELGYDDATPDPPGGRLGRAADGRLDGALYEQPMFDLSTRNYARHFAALDAAGRIAAAERAARHYASLGITSCTDAAIDPTGFGLLRGAEAAGRLPIRVTAMFWYDRADWLLEAGMTTGFGSDRLRLGAIKLFSDGGMSSRTAAVEAPYAATAGTGRAGDTGVLLQPPAALAAMVRRCADAGFQVGIHAQGDRGIRAALDALEPVSTGVNPRRNRIEHGGLFTAPLRRRAGAAGIHVVSQPAFLSILGDGFLEAFGPERSGDLYPFVGLREAGVIVAGSSDSPVVTADPWLGMRDAILRRTDAGAPIAPDEHVDAAEALSMYTTRAAFVDGREHELGLLEPGYLADFVIVDRDPLAIDPADIPSIRVLRTVVGGETVFETAAT